MSDALPLSRPRPHWAWWVVAAVLSFVPAIWAGDAPFNVDEAELVTKAATANAAGVWEQYGLWGTLGKPYGPLPVWLYQIALTLTHDPVQIVRLRAILVTAGTLGGVVWIARLMNVTGAWLLMIAPSPYLLNAARTLWDNSFNVPLSALAAALTLHAVIRRMLWPLPVLLAVLGAMMLVHFMAVALAAGLGLFLVLHARRLIAAADRRSGWVIAAICLAVLAAFWVASEPYRRNLARPVEGHLLMSDRPNGWWFAVFAPRLVSAVWVDFMLPSGYLESVPAYALFAAAQVVTGGVFVLAWAGGGLTIYRLCARRPSPAVTAGALALCVLAAQVPLNGLTHTYGQPHYYHATWIAAGILTAVLLCFVAERRPRAAAAAAGTFAAALAICSGLLAVRLHQTGGTRPDPADPTANNYGPTIANTMQIADAARQAGPRSIRRNDVMRFNQSVTALYLIGRSPPGPVIPRLLELRFARPSDPFDGRIAVAPWSAEPSTRPRDYK